MRKTSIAIIALLTLVCSLNASHATDADLRARFENPGKRHRPLQIVHGFDGLIAPKYKKALDKNLMDELFQISDDSPGDFPNPKSAMKQSLQELKDAGLGGVVCNVSFRDYMRDENQWKLFSLGIETCKELGMRVWIYDEDGYPSGSAGGLVLEKNPAFEAQELILDPNSDAGYTIRPSYEGTHASNNYYVARRYPNLIDKDADDAFITITHDKYAQLCESDFGGTIEAFFTDEPSMMACNLGQIPEEVRKTIRAIDPLDPKVERLPAVPWVHDLPELFQAKYGYDIRTKVKFLFSGFGETDKQARRDFWALVSELIETRFFGAIQQWCGKHNVASSGHALWEEVILYHPALNGNILRNLQRMDVPGIDVLSSRPGNAFHGYSVTAPLASSAAQLNGTRRVMTEISDFSEQMAKQTTSVEEMCATAAWQFALGVTDFNLYYSRSRPKDEYNQYCAFVGRLGELLTPARRVTRVAMYYPIYDLWSGYIPAAERMSIESQPETTQKVVRSFSDTSSQLVRDGVSFCYADFNHLKEAKVDDKKLAIDRAKFDALVIPAVNDIPVEAQKTIDAFKQSGGAVISADGDPAWREKAKAFNRIQVTTQQQGGLWSEFMRNGSPILLLVNTTGEKWSATVKTPPSERLSQWDFATGEVVEISKDQIQDGRFEVRLKAYESIALVWR